MAEKIVSPGVYTNEVDKSFLPAAIGDIGACVIGPTVKGPVLTPTIVSSYAEFQEIFGDIVKVSQVARTNASGLILDVGASNNNASGSQVYTYLTSETAKNYLENGNTLTVVRVMEGAYTHASSKISSSVDPQMVGGGPNGSNNSGSGIPVNTNTMTDSGSNRATASLFFSQSADASGASNKNMMEASMSIGNCWFVFTHKKIAEHINTGSHIMPSFHGSASGDGWSSANHISASRIFIKTGSSAGATAIEFAATLMNADSASIHGLPILSASSKVQSPATKGLVMVTASHAGPSGLYGGTFRTSGSNHLGAHLSGTLTIESGAFNRGAVAATANAGFAGTKQFEGGANFNNGVPRVPFTLHTLGVGSIMNNKPANNKFSESVASPYSISDGILVGPKLEQDGPNHRTPASASRLDNHDVRLGLNADLKTGVLPSGSEQNVRWEISQVNQKKGTFTLNIRSGNDKTTNKNILESYPDLTLDEYSPNYIAKRIGDSYLTIRNSGTDDPYLEVTGSYPNKSKYIRVEVHETTPNYLNEDGSVREPDYSASLPYYSGSAWSGSHGGSFSGGSDGYIGFNTLGHVSGTAVASTDNLNVNFYENIGTQTQGFYPETVDKGKNAYLDALNLISNQDEYDVNLILMPGIISNTHTSIASKAIDVAEGRGDCFVVLDPVPYGSDINTATTEAKTKDSSYSAMYWPWIKMQSNQLGRTIWTPPSVGVSGVYTLNDKVSYEWFAPAGLNRGTISTAQQAERKLTQSNRDDLYSSNVNPIATFPGQGVCVWGQKTLQQSPSALDRVNVRRLLIKLKKFIASTSRFLVFEQNNSKTRQRFLSIVNPYMEQVQSNSGLNAFKVVMDDTNNTPDVVDRNMLVGQIFVQPTQTAEFIVLDFTVQRTGATFPE